jgi:hypothetical protein
MAGGPPDAIRAFGSAPDRHPVDGCRVCQPYALGRRRRRRVGRQPGPAGPVRKSLRGRGGPASRRGAGGPPASRSGRRTRSGRGGGTVGFLPMGFTLRRRSCASPHASRTGGVLALMPMPCAWAVFSHSAACFKSWRHSCVMPLAFCSWRRVAGLCARRVPWPPWHDRNPPRS